MGFVKRRATTKAKVTVENFESLKVQFLLDVKNVVEMDEIAPEPVINRDQTGIYYVPVASSTMEKEGSKRIEIVGIDIDLSEYGPYDSMKRYCFIKQV